MDEIIVVEGKHDAQAVKRAVDAEVIITGGTSLPPEVLERIRFAQARKGVIIFTDPDYPGEAIRRKINTAVPGCKHAFLSREEATDGTDIGIEHASPELIRAALAKVRTALPPTQQVFFRADLLAAGLDGTPGAAKRRAQLGKILGIGYTNAKQFLHRLNHYGITRAEFVQALTQLNGEGGEKGAHTKDC